MINIGDLLKNYAEIKNPIVDKTAISSDLNMKFNLNIKEDQIFFRKNIIILKVNSVQKNFIFIRKNEILENIKNIVPNRFINTIQF